MTTYLVATSSVHVTAAAADYLQDRLDPTSDGVVVVGVEESSDSEPADAGSTDGAPPGRRASDRARDVADAANVACSRLASVAPTIDLREGDVLEELRAAVDAHDPDVVVIGTNAGTATAEGLGSTARALLASLDRPIVVTSTS